MIKESKLIGTKVSMPYGWREFKVGDLFDVSGTHGFDKGDIVLSSHGTEFIGRTETNNGVQGFYDDPFVAPNEANTISISQIGAQTAQYRRNQWYASQNLFKLIPKFEMHERHALFLIGFINRGLSIYSGYSHFPKVVDIADMQLLLPVTQDEQPDYGWMSSYIRELENQRIRELENQRIRELENQRIRELNTYLQVTGLDDITLTDNELQVLEQWRQHEKFGGTLLTKRFRVSDLFILKNTKAYNELPDDMVLSSNDNANVPFVTTQFNNNGIVGFSELQPLNSGNRITYSDTTTGDAIFYQPNAYIGRSHVIYMEPNFEGFNKYVAMFVMALIRKQTSGNFDYGKKLNKQAMYNMVLELPVMADGTPDYDFMQTFIRAQEKRVMQNLAEFRQRQIDTTRQII